MYTGLLHLHNILRWVILILLMVNVYRHLTASVQPYGEKDRKLGLFLMIAAHTMLVLGLFQYFFGGVGYNAFKEAGFATVMKDRVTRYWAVEHIGGMLVAIVLITLGYGVRKKQTSDLAKHRLALIYYVIALLLVLASMPWPWRAGVSRAWLPGIGA
jgi:hypothetical protein